MLPILSVSHGLVLCICSLRNDLLAVVVRLLLAEGKARTLQLVLSFGKLPTCRRESNCNWSKIFFVVVKVTFDILNLKFSLASE